MDPDRIAAGSMGESQQVLARISGISHHAVIRFTPRDLGDPHQVLTLVSLLLLMPQPRSPYSITAFNS